MFGRKGNTCCKHDFQKVFENSEALNILMFYFQLSDMHLTKPY